MTPEELENARALRRLEKAREQRRVEREQEAAATFAQSQARPLPRAAAPEYPEFAPTFAVDKKAREAAEAKAKAEVASRGSTLPPGASVAEARQTFAEEALQTAEQARARTVQPGVERPSTPGGFPMFRPTRIEEIPFVELTPGGERVAVEDVAKYGPYDPDALMADQKPEIRRMYRDPETGVLRKPTLTEEFTESFAQQTEVSEARFRQEAETRKQQQKKIDAAVARGEDVPFFDRYLMPATFGVLTSERQGKGLVETPLGATLRAGLSYLENAAAEGYFRAAGYEVDDRGLPVDPDDYALVLKQAREAAGIPEVAYPLQLPGELASRVLSDTDEGRQKIKDLFAAVPQLAIPLPGFATERQKVKTTRFDPEGRRVVSEEEAPDLLQKPREALDFYAQKVVENVAKGRTFADEWYDTPAIREYYTNTTGDDEWAFFAGMVPSLFTPAGPGTALRTAGTMLSKGADVAGISAKARSLAALERAAEDLRVANAAANAAGPIAPQPLAKARAIAQSRFEDLTRQAAARTSPGVVRAVAAHATKIAIPDSNKAKAFIAAVKNPVNKVETPADLLRLADSSGLLDADEAARVARLTSRNTPDDYVMISDAVAVPRYQAREMKQTLDTLRQPLFLANIPTMASRLRDLATQVPAGPLRAKLNALASQLINSPTASLRPGNYLAYGDFFKNLNKQVQGEITVAVREAAKRLGNNPAKAVKEFSQNTPKEAFGFSPGIGKELHKYASWDDVPAALRRQAIDAYDVKLLVSLGEHARKANQLTRAQLYFDTAEQGLSSLAQSKFLDTPFMRRALAVAGKQRTETLSAARVANEIARAGQTSLRDLRKLFEAEVKRTGTVPKALNDMMRNELTKSGETPEAAWDALYGLVYTDRYKDNALTAAAIRAPGFNSVYPTIDAARALDSALAKGNLVPGVFQPSFETAFLNVIMENGLRKNISKAKRDTQLAEAAATGNVNLKLGQSITVQALDDLLKQEGKLLPLPERAGPVPVPAYFDEFMGVRGHVYDKAVGQAEKMLAEGVGEGLFAALDTIPVRARADVVSYVRDAADLVVGTGRRNLLQRMTYGYIVPNLLTQGGRLLSMAIIPLTTIGARNTLAATGRGFERAAEAVGMRRLTGGGITNPDGVYYSPKVLDDLANDYGLGVSQLETERVGSLARELMNEANRQAASLGPIGAFDTLRASVFNPFDKGFFLRAAESIELNFRKSVFEMALARGDVPAEAAELARKSQFDYSRTPDFVQKQVAQYLGESSAIYQGLAEALLRIKDNPQAATFVLKANRQKAEANDPYNVHGDKALKSLGIVTTDNRDTYYLPETPLLRPVEAVLGATRRADLLAQDIKDAYKLEGAFGGAYAAAAGSGGLFLRTVGDVLLPGVIEAYDRFEEGEEYITTGVPEATPMSDEKTFWTLALSAHLHDPEHAPGGEWRTFIDTFDPIEVTPPAEHTAEIDGRKYWTRQPPEGTPHLFMGFDDKNRRLYYAFKPSSKGLRNIKIMRTLTPETLERVFPVYLAMRDFEKAAPAKATAPYEVYAEPLVPSTVGKAAAQALFPPVEMSPEEARRQQAEAIKGVREQIKVD